MIIEFEMNDLSLHYILVSLLSTTYLLLMQKTSLRQNEYFKTFENIIEDQLVSYGL